MTIKHIVWKAIGGGVLWAVALVVFDVPIVTGIIVPVVVVSALALVYDVVMAVRIERASRSFLAGLSDAEARAGRQRIPSMTDPLHIRRLVDCVERRESAAREIVNTIQELSESVNQICRASEEVAAGVRQQATRLQHSADTVSRITDNAKKKSRKAMSTSELTERAAREIVESVDLVKDVVESMDVLERGSKKIADIVGIIDEITDQTNLLALNAAIEAARAGEHGKGFTIVADEVRKLAERTSLAAHEISTLINENLAKLTRNLTLAEEASDKLDNTAARISDTATQVHDLASAFIEQSNDSMDIAAAISQLDALTQQTAAAARRTTTAVDHIVRKLRDVSEGSGDRTPDRAPGPGKPTPPADSLPARDRVETLSDVV